MTNDNNVYIFSLKTGTWKKIGDFLHGQTQSCASGMFSNGALHWANADQNLGPWTIVALDLAKETYCEVLQPVCGEGKENLSLGVLGQWLCVHCNSDISRELDVWVMKVYGVKDSWTKLVIPYPNDFFWIDYVVPLCISNDGKVLLRFESEFVVYDIHNSSSTQLSQNFNRWDEICIVAESLVSPCFPHIRNGSGSSVMENAIV
ncbi:F-box associated interaction domain-containing protein [Artemisia annua]|uniref:F-box associated interaction domain-containing protein n=1 Tax=Artemisia annua TaxID=35608 RepID=A0A2U1NA07_ARTAN|nr:F-box associated interaction domain-containing protein [Artemisia annua]